MLLSIALGGALGAIGRYLVMSGVGRWLSDFTPIATLSVNVLGSFILGALIEVLALTWSPGREMQAFMVVGVLGSFTTFSAFSMDVIFLLERGDMAGAASYVVVSVVASVVALFLGMYLFRQVLA
ncbi:MAG: fluoride efflux transporter CrcB [Rhodospirillales bacterium]|nr:fluoride efflux transporter CrcB [Rhodospirillales bacterium]